MIFERTHIILVALVAAATLSHAGESISIGETRPIPTATFAAGATHDLALHVYTFRGTRWTSDEIAAAVTESAKLLTQCGIALAHAQLNVIEAPRRFHDYYTPVSRELLRMMDTPKPAVFFVQDTRNRPAFDAEAIGLANAARRPELANTLWVAYGARDVAHALAHELAHVLSNNGEHSDEPQNLMRTETAPENSRLTPAQCDGIRSRGEANGLLRRR
jgi:hypothetical protein